jgi:hypothetical protein
MPNDATDLTPASRDDLELAIAFALRSRRRKRFRAADDIMATITAERIIEHLEEAGFVVMRKPTPLPDSTSVARGYEGR